MDFLLKGILIGLLFGLPAGAIGALTVQRTLFYGIRAGLLTGLGSSIADCFYACIGVFGLTLISDFLLQYQTIINILGGGLIFLTGASLFFRKGTPAKHHTESAGLTRMFFSSFGIGIANPAAILTFLFAFSWFGISTASQFSQGILLVCGVLMGTYVWWGGLACAASLLRKKTDPFHFQWMNRLFGTILCLFGTIIFLRLFI